MDEPKLRDAFRLLDDAVTRGDTPGGVALIGRHGRIAGLYATGAAHTAAVVTDHAGEAVIPARTDTIYDCASLTKVVATLPLVLQLVERGLLRLSDPVAEYIPAFAAGGKEAVTVRQLLTHTSGLISHINMYSHGWTPEEIKQHVFSRPLDYEPGTKAVYSDLGFITLGEIVSVLTGEPLDAAAAKYVFAPLGMNNTRFLPLEAEGQRPRIAATEYNEALGRHKLGEVHDENALALGGVSGHAGLFSTAEDLAKYAAMWLAGGRIGDTGRLLSEASVAAATRSCTDQLPAARGLGWVLKGDSFDASGDLMSPSCYGHTGFTGTSIWMDPALDCFAVLLTNRVHFGREKSVARLRGCFHNVVAAACL
ncbi:class A beta-lactamase-related serine hydrolase [Paenibacillus ginsengarvi]|uniref:Class A beta-lactamase-related serine hydrolase n=2 Tax=Paenibacillus ginsengarvi TaxID=400777 RepID=A0A3B0CKF8_9BACL|nr:class A beta-lactamase-related serine hydrolase [Paenibacillus ginsengarvi]